MRLLTPLLFLLAGAWVWWSNDTHPDRVVTLPFLDVVTDDVHRQGELTAAICVGLGAWFLVWDVVAKLRKKEDR